MFLVFTSVAYLIVSSVSAQSQCEVPEAVNNLKAEKTTNTTTHLSWQPPASTECLDHYKITYCSYLYDEERECAVKTVVIPLNTIQYDITGLKPCKKNKIHVHSVATDGTETYSEMIIYTGSGDPPKVEKVDLSHVGAINVTLDWERPRGFSDLCYPGYQVCYFAKGDNKETCSYTLTEEFTVSSGAPLSPCTEYNFSVATVDGNFAADSKTSEKTYASVVTVPQMPNVTIEVYNHTVHATWSAPDALSMTCAANFLVKNCRMTERFFPPDCKTVSSQTLPLNATKATISGLQSCTNNHVSITLVGLNGQSSGKEVIIADHDDVEIPMPSYAEPPEVTASSITVTYEKSNKDCVSSYRACWFTEDEIETCGYTTSIYSVTFIGFVLKPCSNYTLHFTVLGSGGKSSENLTTTFLTGPSNSPDLEVSPSPHSALVSWKTAPSALQCGTNYIVSWRKHLSGERAQRAVLPLNTTSYNITGLTSCTQYEVSLQTEGHNSTTSGESTVVIKSLLGGVSPITIGDINYIEDTIYIDWDYPDNSLYCLRSFVTCWFESAESQSQEQCEEGALSWDRSVLKACVNYTFVATARMEGYNRTISGSSPFTPGPDKVANLTVHEDSTTRTVNLSWINKPTNHLCAEYIQVTTTRIEDKQVTTVKLSNDATSTLVTDLSPCTTYLFEVMPVASFIDSDSDYLVRHTTACSGAVPGES